MKTKLIRSAIPIYIAAAVWILFGMALPLFTIPYILMATGLSVAAYLVAGKFFPGRKVEVAEVLFSGDSALDKQLKESADALSRLREANEDIPSPTITAQLDRVDAAGRKILSAVAEKPARAAQVRKFLNYYLPTTDKLLKQYRVLRDGGSGENVKKAMLSVESSLDMIARAFEKQLDNLYRDEALDITTDVQVLETMMASDGLTDEGIKQVMKTKEETSK